MQPVTPIIPGASLPVTNIAENQPQYKALPAYIQSDGTVVTRWKLSFRERLRLLFTGSIYHWQMTFGEPLQPLSMQVNKPKLHGLFEPPADISEMYKRGCERTA